MQKGVTMTHDEARRIVRNPRADPFDRYDAHKLLSTPEPLPPPAREQRLDTAQSEPDSARWLDARIEEKLATQRKFLLDVFARALGQSLAKERKVAKAELEDSVRSLKIELAQAQTVISELRLIVAAERGVVDRPSPLRARVN
jgi:hypothetical protein